MRNALFCLVAHLAIVVGQTPPQSLSPTDAVRIALASRPAIRAAEAKVRQAERSRAAMSVPLPTRGEFGRGTFPDVGGGEDLLIAQPLDLFGRSSAGRAAGQAAVLTAKADLRQAKLDVQDAVLNAFSEARSAQTLLGVDEKLLELAEQVYAATKRKVEQGESPPAQLLRADLDRERAKQTVELRRGALVAAQVRLSGAMGAPAEEVRQALLEGGPNAENLASIESRPDIQSLRAGVTAGKAEVLGEQVYAMPEIEIQFRRSLWSEPEQYGVRLQFVMPLWDWGANRNRVRAAKAGLDADQASVSDRETWARTELVASQADQVAAKSAVESFARLAEDARTLLQKEQRGFDLGATTLLDLLDASRALREIQESAIEAQLRLDLANAKLLAVTGTILGESK